MENARYVNLLTHGCVDKDEAYLVFFCGEDTNKCYLTISDVFKLKMNADIVVMAACQSGSGKIVGGEGMMSLTRGLFYSGANNIIYGLYPLKANFMSELVYNFYQYHNTNNNFTKSLQKGKINLINRDVNIQDWSSLILMGVD